VHAFDELALRAGKLTPTHMFAVLSSQPGPRLCSRGLTPERSVRWPTRLAALTAVRRRYRWWST
jgi:hypothetical protein